MAKKKLKDFVREHKGKIIAGAVGVTAGVAGFLIGRKTELGYSKVVKQFGKDIELVVTGNKAYVPVTNSNEVEALLTSSVIKGAGDSTLRVKSIMLFGDEM